jgi:hypothetical protein
MLFTFAQKGNTLTRPPIENLFKKKMNFPEAPAMRQQRQA